MSDLPDLMEKVQAAEAIGLANKSEQAKLDVFMALFHPDHDRIDLAESDLPAAAIGDSE